MIIEPRVNYFLTPYLPCRSFYNGKEVPSLDGKIKQTQSQLLFPAYRFLTFLNRVYAPTSVK